MTFTLRRLAQPTEREREIGAVRGHRLQSISAEHLRFNGITLRFGGKDTLLITNCENLEFDHVNIRGSSNAIRFEVDGDQHNDRMVFHDCEIDGGLPT